MSQGRSIYRQIFKNFINSFKLKKVWGEFRGRDYFGTEYYESPQSLQGHNRPSRWFVPVVKDKFDQEIPPEWEQWLRYRRNDVPTEEEIQYNLLRIKKTKENAAKLEASRTVKIDEPKEKSSFPVYEDYDDTPKDKNVKVNNTKGPF